MAGIQTDYASFRSASTCPGDPGLADPDVYFRFGDSHCGVVRRKGHANPWTAESLDQWTGMLIPGPESLDRPRKDVGVY